MLLRRSHAVVGEQAYHYGKRVFVFTGSLLWREERMTPGGACPGFPTVSSPSLKRNSQGKQLQVKGTSPPGWGNPGGGPHTDGEGRGTQPLLGEVDASKLLMVRQRGG